MALSGQFVVPPTGRKKLPVTTTMAESQVLPHFITDVFLDSEYKCFSYSKIFPCALIFTLSFNILLIINLQYYPFTEGS